MDTILKRVNYLYYDFWEEYGDERHTFPLLKGGPWKVLAPTLLYLYFVLYAGPKWMKNRQPFELRLIMLLHNILLVIINGIGFTFGMWATDFGLITLKCDRFNPASTVFRDRIFMYLGYTYFISKFIDFLDTVYFVLRKKQSHVTGLHVFHHTLMPSMCYVYFKFSSYTNNGFIPLINSFVHTVMYSYYALSALGPNVQRYLWWKKYITQLQLIQFVLLTIHSMYMLFNPNCNCPRPLNLLHVIHGILFLNLFGNFYRRTYVANCNKKKLQQSSDEKISHSNDKLGEKTELNKLQRIKKKIQLKND